MNLIKSLSKSMRYNRFGGSVAVSGKTMVVGAPLKNNAVVNDVGAAYVYRFDGTEWLETELLASDGAAGDRFGDSVAVSGDTVIVGVPYKNHKIEFEPKKILESNGAAYVYRFDGTEWIEMKLLASDGAAGNRFGYSVSIDGNTAVVGSPYGDDSGAVYVYRFDGTNWIESTKLLASDGVKYDKFGHSVAVSGDTMIIGALYAKNNKGFNAGAAYIYKFDGTKWIESKKLISDDNLLGDSSFGFSVAISGNTAVVGAPYGHTPSSAHVYEFNGTDWIKSKEFAGEFGSYFGRSVAVSGKTVVVGAPFEASAIGAVYVFYKFDEGWLETEFLAGDGASDDNFGSSVSVSDDTMVIGVPITGSAYIYK